MHMIILSYSADRKKEQKKKHIVYILCRKKKQMALRSVIKQGKKKCSFVLLESFLQFAKHKDYVCKLYLKLMGRHIWS